MRDDPPLATKALVFDVFGTLVDWRGGVARAVERHVSPIVPALDPGAFADAWRGQYQPAMAAVRDGRRPWTNLDVLHAENLMHVLSEYGVRDIPEDTRTALVRAWHELDAWPDVASALSRLRSRYLLAPLSNGHIALSISLARRNGFPWDAVLGAELARDYKPSVAVYEGGVAALGLEPREVLMVACHSDDLAAAAACGLGTVHIARPNEKGPGLGETKPSIAVDHAARDLADLADMLLKDARHASDAR
jgi:2-haloacid dehalogenase